MMLVALTGTPGVGKSTVSSLLRERYDVIDIHSFCEKNGLFESFDSDAGSYNVDVEKLNDAIHNERLNDITIMDGHLSHFVDCDIIIVLRCDPDIICERLRSRGYDEKKVIENVQTEVLDIILSESAESGTRTYEIDCSGFSVEDVYTVIVSIIEGKDDSHEPGKVDWSDRMDHWF